MLRRFSIVLEVNASCFADAHLLYNAVTKCADSVASLYACELSASTVVETEDAVSLSNEEKTALLEE